MDHKFKILMVIAVFYPYTGGAEKQAEKLSGELMKKGLDITVITGRWSNLIRKREEFNGIKIIRNLTNLLLPKKSTLNTDISFFKPYDKKGLRTFLKKIFVRCCVYLYQLSLFIFLILHGKKYDVIHVHQVLYPAFISTLAASIIKKPVIAKVGSSGSNSDINQIKKFPEGKLQLKYTLKHLTRLICTSSSMIDEFANEGMDKKKMVLIRNGVSAKDFQRSYTDYRRLVYLGRFIKSKDIPTLLSAFSRLLKKYTDLKLTLIGDGPERENITYLVKKLGLQNNIIMTGMVRDPASILKKNDIFIFPSLIEGLSNSLIEAMSLKLPCIVTGIEGNREVMAAGKVGFTDDFLETKNGILFKKKDVKGLVKGLEHMIEDKSLRAKLGENGFLRVKREFSLDKIAEKYIRLYEEIII
jgi:glycosyltransferase involved in cell wall biosynthesis